MNGVRRQGHPLLDRHHRHGGVAAQERGEERRTFGEDVHDHHVTQAAVGGHHGKKMLQRLQAAGGGADAHDQGNCSSRFYRFAGGFGRGGHTDFFGGGLLVRGHVGTSASLYDQ